MFEVQGRGCWVKIEGLGFRDFGVQDLRFSGKGRLFFKGWGDGLGLIPLHFADTVSCTLQSTEFCLCEPVNFSVHGRARSLSDGVKNKDLQGRVRDLKRSVSTGFEGGFRGQCS